MKNKPFDAISAADVEPSIARWAIELFTKDWIFPQYNRYLPWRQPVVVLVSACLVSAGCGVWIDPAVHAITGAILSVVLIGLLWPILTLQTVSATIAFDHDRAREREPLRATLTVDNRSLLPAWGLHLDAGDLSGWMRGVDAAFIHVRPFGRSRVELTLEPDRRGEFPGAWNRSPRVACSFPFGIWEHSRPIAFVSSVLVWPGVIPIQSLPQTNVPAIAETCLTALRSGDAGDVIGLRPYRRGDSSRRIHWPQSAKYDRLIVAERQSSTANLLEVWIDLDPAVHFESVGGGSREWAIRIAASLLERGARDGTPMLLVLPASAARVTGPGKGLRDALDALALLDLEKAAERSEDVLPISARMRGGRLLVSTHWGLERFASSRGSEWRVAILPEGAMRPRSAWLSVSDLHRWEKLLGKTRDDAA